ncbi:photosystem II stability/assembly factor-like uncharacterized protein [Mesonia hippocampi]|uniref:Photosystem II stability/assembly factor-like uncharacterized protein n=1 Tax=Mesonia hippocampi TaxID=1628250 RepID=A0A840ELM8_9FLAO|nr:oxidoreductase [Mesonia hippocampi]MBB4118001.1 photosystem II stability/assembly factor-like uncharacterized protein [Mesonia hippocampi]
MKKITFVIFLSVIIIGCVNITSKEIKSPAYKAVKVETVFESPISIRALDVTPDYLLFSGSQGRFGYIHTTDHSLAYIGTVSEDGSLPDFRALAKNNQADFILSAGNPSFLYKVNYLGKRKMVYKETGDNVFYNAMAFWNTNEGIAVGDPTNGCMSVIITKDGGDSWVKVPCHKLPDALPGEVGFAASNTNIVIQGNKAWFISGGKTKSRVYYTEDKGDSWEAYNTPILRGNESSGAYSIDFYDENRGFIVGGDFSKPEENRANKAITIDGGKTWNLIASGTNPGYKSCVKYVPNSEGRELVAVGKTGISYSSNYGNSWKKLSEEGFYTFTFVNEYTGYAAGNGKIAKITFLEEEKAVE